MKIKICLFSICIILGLTGCNGNSGNITDGLTNSTNTFNYILTLEAGEYHLHEIAKWMDSESSDALGVSTKCCENQFWTSYNTAMIYRNKPIYLSKNIIVCGEGLK